MPWLAKVDEPIAVVYGIYLLSLHVALLDGPLALVQYFLIYSESE